MLIVVFVPPRFTLFDTRYFKTGSKIQVMRAEMTVGSRVRRADCPGKTRLLHPDTKMPGRSPANCERKCVQRGTRNERKMGGEPLVTHHQNMPAAFNFQGRKNNNLFARQDLTENDSGAAAA
ncbi:hypothetical protein [Phyllobacterium calauticae]|uniref:hypothetical protein n=1 Tax=Phyllobacterium calauticae TaxID=2817027 RepID=UPI001CBE716E|nr:hypothetical protein [Phyllobacterium calauticae]MBZ3692064.1 hypothetical protein [Phyllobacterium calauticae]